MPLVTTYSYTIKNETERKNERKTENEGRERAGCPPRQEINRKDNRKTGKEEIGGTKCYYGGP